MTPNILLNLDGTWMMIEGKACRMSSEYPTLTQPTVVISDFEACMAGKTSITGNARYIDAQIAWRLREEGQVDGESKVLIHDKRRATGSWHVIYSAVLQTVHQKIMAWVRTQPDHCLMIPKVGLMQRIMMQTKDAVLFQCGREFTLLHQRANAVSYYSVVALSETESDFVQAIQSLAEQVRMAQGDDLPSGLRWYVLGEGMGAEELPTIQAPLFENNLFRRIEVPTQTYERPNGGLPFVLSVEALRPFFSEKISLNPSQDQWLFFAESHLAAFSFGALVAAGCFMLFAMSAFVQSVRVNSAAEGLQEQARSINAKVDELRIPEPDPQFFKTRGFIETMARAQASLDPYVFLKQLQESAGSDVKLLNISVDAGKQKILIEGWTERNPEAALSMFVAKLRRLGYSPESIEVAGSPYAQRTGYFNYQLSLPSWQGGDHEP